jgi:hypothetical protein
LPDQADRAGVLGEGCGKGRRCVIWLNFDKWAASYGRWFVVERIYRRGQWTPLVRVSWRPTYRAQNGRRY